MNEYTPYQMRQLLKVIYCMNLDVFCDMYIETAPNTSGHTHSDYWLLAKFHQMKNNLFEWFCELDDDSLNQICHFTSRRMLMQALK